MRGSIVMRVLELIVGESDVLLGDQADRQSFEPVEARQTALESDRPLPRVVVHEGEEASQGDGALHALPALILVDRGGRVMRVWLGRLSEDKEVEVFKAVSP
jgi:hypothetical protein